jgi:hypothetical protein
MDDDGLVSLLLDTRGILWRLGDLRTDRGHTATEVR